MGELKRLSVKLHFDNPVEEIWPILSDTALVNESTGFPQHEIEEILQPDGSQKFIATANIAGYKVIWDDKPKNWVTNHWYIHDRYFLNSPLKYLSAAMEISPTSEMGKTGCVVEVKLAVQARNLVGSFIVQRILKASARGIENLGIAVREFTAGHSEQKFKMPPVKLADGVLEKLSKLSHELDESDYGHGLSSKIIEFITTRPESECTTIRPLALARQWDMPSRLVVEACLQAAKIGILGTRWDLLCPRCQIGKGSADNLSDMPTGTHCPSCNIDFERDFTKNLELAFYPSRAIRPLDLKEYCLFSAMSTPHIKIQMTLSAQNERIEAAALAHGLYRFRTLEPGDEIIFEWRGGVFPTLIVDGDEMIASPQSQDGAEAVGQIIFVNKSDRSLTFILEEYTWKRDVLTAHQVTTMQAFRVLFDEDVLRAGDNVEIDNATMMFTDFKGSTALYERLGDAQAYYLIRQFFAVLAKAIRVNNGAVVKTIGDAVHAAFFMPLDAIRAAIQIQKDMTEFNDTSGKEPIGVTIGLHIGSCISVTLNDQLDYYGSTVNKTARLEGQSMGGDVVLSDDFASDPAVSALLKGKDVKKETVKLKGFDDPVEFIRINAADFYVN